MSPGRLFRPAAYLVTIAVFVIVAAVTRNWKNDALGYKLNLGLVSGTNIIWFSGRRAAGVTPQLCRRLFPLAIWKAAVILVGIGQG